MLKYLIVLLDDTSVSFCHYRNSTTPLLMQKDTLEASVKFAMKHNAIVQFILPTSGIPQDYYEIMEKVRNVKIAPIAAANSETDVVVAEISDTSVAPCLNHQGLLVIRGTLNEFIENNNIIKAALKRKERTNFVITDIASLNDDVLIRYNELLIWLVDEIVANENIPDCNILTDRLKLSYMNNCGAGVETLTVAPSGELHVCPGFYYDGGDSIGNVKTGFEIPNGRLYSIKYAPICSSCDAFQCKRCVWLNKLTTLEVNTPSYQQCVLAHYERNASRILHHKNPHCNKLFPDIPEINYIDPFENVRHKY